MALQLPNFQRISFDEANPWLVGAERGQKYTQNAMMFPEDLQKAILANQLSQYKVQEQGARAPYFPQLAKAELLKSQAEPQEILARAGQESAQAGKLGQETQWYGREAAARIKAQEAEAGMHGTEAQKNALIIKYMNEGMNPPSMTPIAQSSSSSATQQQPSSSDNTQQQSYAPSVYGIQTPSPTRQDLISKMVFGIDTYTPRMENAKKQQQDQYDKYQNELASSVKEANSANNMNQAINVFNNAMNESTYKGAHLGHIPSSGVGAALVPGNLSPEQRADRAALQMLPSAIETMRDAMGSARFSNLDVNMSSKMKFDRTMDDETRKTQTAWIGAVNDRLKEKPKFYQILSNPSSGASKAQADMLWQNYQNNFPLINGNGDKVLKDNLGNWPLYTTPKALASIQKTGGYIPSSAERNTFMMKLPDGKGGFIIAPVKKGKVESALRKGALPL